MHNHELDQRIILSKRDDITYQKSARTRAEYGEDGRLGRSFNVVAVVDHANFWLNWQFPLRVKLVPVLAEQDRDSDEIDGQTAKQEERGVVAEIALDGVLTDLVEIDPRTCSDHQKGGVYERDYAIEERFFQLALEVPTDSRSTLTAISQSQVKHDKKGHEEEHKCNRAQIQYTIRIAVACLPEMQVHWIIHLDGGQDRGQDYWRIVHLGIWYFEQVTVEVFDATEREDVYEHDMDYDLQVDERIH